MCLFWLPGGGVSVFCQLVGPLCFQTVSLYSVFPINADVKQANALLILIRTAFYASP